MEGLREGMYKISRESLVVSESKSDQKMLKIFTGHKNQLDEVSTG